MPTSSARAPRGRLCLRTDIEEDEGVRLGPAILSERSLLYQFHVINDDKKVCTPLRDTCTVHIAKIRKIETKLYGFGEDI
eukprot:1319616-Amorphochlora_amoeboformis.AAC.1